jgi:hypothetical protein
MFVAATHRGDGNVSFCAPMKNWRRLWNAIGGLSRCELH